MNKRQTVRNILIMTMVLLSPHCVYSQVPEHEMRLAVDILKGKDNAQTKAWAVSTLESSLQYKEDAYALNVLGIAYLHGIGAEADTVKALSYLSSSGERGYKLAYHNLGMYYKYADGSRQDFVKAYEAFSRGAAAGSTACRYDKGFMLYKGLGCAQDYEEAVAEFDKAADNDHPAALFMLGLCYRNGYGVDADADLATAYLKRAAALGRRDAMDELSREKPENSLPACLLGRDARQSLPERMPAITPYVPGDKSSLDGAYSGYLVTYDWSGQHALSEVPVRLNATTKADSVTFVWHIGTDTIQTRAVLSDDGALRFGDEEIVRCDRYSSTNRSLYRFDEASISYADGMLTGSLRLYSIDEREPEKPMYVSLRKSSSCSDGDACSQICSYPNPYTDVVTLKFDLSESSSSAKICLYTGGGVCKEVYNIGALEAGEHTYTIAPAPGEKTYVVHVIAGAALYQMVIIRKDK